MNRRGTWPGGTCDSENLAWEEVWSCFAAAAVVGFGTAYEKLEAAPSGLAHDPGLF